MHNACDQGDCTPKRMMVFASDLAWYSYKLAAAEARSHLYALEMVVASGNIILSCSNNT